MEAREREGRAVRGYQQIAVEPGRLRWRELELHRPVGEHGRWCLFVKRPALRVLELALLDGLRHRSRAGGRGLLALQTQPHRLRVELGRLALLDGDGVHRTFAEAVAEPVAVDIAHKARLAVDHLDRSLGARWYALSAAVALLLVDVHDLP